MLIWDSSTSLRMGYGTQVAAKAYWPLVFKKKMVIVSKLANEDMYIVKQTSIMYYSNVYRFLHILKINPL